MDYFENIMGEVVEVLMGAPILSVQRYNDDLNYMTYSTCMYRKKHLTLCALFSFQIDTTL